MRFEGLTIGVPKEILHDERRVAVTPDTIRKITEQGGRVIVEKGAGDGSHFTDDDYRAVGAEIMGDVALLFERADIVMKVKEPQYNEDKGRHEIEMMKRNCCLIAFLHPASPANHDMVKKLASAGVTSFTLDSIPRISRAQRMDALTSMSTVAGYKGVLMASNSLPKFMPMVGTAAGTIKPASVLVIGAGVAGLQAIATAKRLGAVVHASDIRAEACEQAKSIGAKIIDTNVPAEIAVGEGGYAKKLPAEWLEKERETLGEHISAADIMILSALIPGKLAPVLVTGEMVKTMKPGSVIVDIAIDQGGNCEITESGETAVKHGVTIMGIKNIPGTVPHTSTGMFAHNIYYFLENLVKDGRINIDMNDEIIASCLLTRDGGIVHDGAREAMNLE